MATPCAATVGGQQIRLIKFDYDGNDRVGLTAKYRLPDGSRYSITASDVVVEDAAAQRYIARLIADGRASRHIHGKR